MGGFGSGRRAKKRVVEDCVVLTVRTLLRRGIVGSNVRDWGKLLLRDSMSARLLSVTYHAGGVIGSNPSLRLIYTVGQQSMEYTIDLTSTLAPWGAARWWFSCPFTVQERACSR